VYRNYSAPLVASFSLLTQSHQTYTIHNLSTETHAYNVRVILTVQNQSSVENIKELKTYKSEFNFLFFSVESKFISLESKLKKYSNCKRDFFRNKFVTTLLSNLFFFFSASTLKNTRHKLTALFARTRSISFMY
jgi:hypothetical protein